MKKLLSFALVAALPGSAQAMDVQTFLAKADALKAKGPLALFSRDLKLLKSEIQTQSESLRSERLAAKAAGKPQAYCPQGDSGSMDSDELLAAFRTIPEPQRPRIQVRDALKALLARKFPCR
jgi:hypothetical protein